MVDFGPSATSLRLDYLIDAIFDALSAGVATSSSIHIDRGWSPAADRHLDRQLVRREAMEHLRPFGASPDEHGSLGLPMSGLILRSSPDVIRIWHSDDGEIPPIETDSLRAFCRQPPVVQTSLWQHRSSLLQQTNNVALLWDTGIRKDIVRFELLRPYGVAGRRALIDWRLPLLPRPTRGVDLGF